LPALKPQLLDINRRQTRLTSTFNEESSFGFDATSSPDFRCGSSITIRISRRISNGAASNAFW
jgi:hypothetical protein